MARREVAGPYRSQSSVPSIRRKATRHEHRKIEINPLDAFDHLIGPQDPFHVEPVGSQPARSAPRRQAAPSALTKLTSLLNLPVGLTPPETALGQAFGGHQPAAALREEYGPELFKRITDVALEQIAQKEGVDADPIAELALTAGLTAGLGGVASLLRGGTQAAVGAAEAGLAAEEAGNASGLATQLGGRVAGQALAHPVVTQGALLGTANKAGIKGGGVEIPGALLEGHAKALLHPGKTLPTTARALAGIVAAPAAIGYSAIKSAAEGTPDPLVNTLTEQGAGLQQMGEHLLSGDPDEVQKAVEDEAGLSFLVPLPALTRTERYQRARSGVREVAQRAREDLADRTGLPLRRGPEEQKVFGFNERRGQRRDVARITQNETLPGKLAAARYERPIVENARKAPGARSLGNLRGMEGGDLIHTFADYGITSPEQFQLLRERGPVSSVPAREGDVNLRAALDFAEQHPDIASSPKLYEAVNDYRNAAENFPTNLAGNGERAAALPQAQLFGVRDAVDRVPVAARKFTEAEDRAGAWKDLKASERRAKDLRHEGRTEALRYAEAQRAGNTEEAAIARAASEERYISARQLEERNREFKGELKYYSRPGAAVSSRARRKLWDKSLVDEMVAETRKAAEPHGLVPGVYTQHSPLRQEGEVAPQARMGNAATRVQHVRRSDEFSLAAADNVDRSLRGLLAGLEGAHMRAAGKQLARAFFSKYSTPIRIADGVTKRRVTQGQFSQAIRDGQLSEEHHVWVPEAQYKQAYLDENVPPERYAAEAHAALRGEVQVTSKGAKGVVVPKEAFKEYAAQIDPVRGLASRFVNNVSKGAGRVLLFSPAWVEAQMIAEALPIVMSNPRLLNPAYIAKLDKRWKEFEKIHPNEAMGFAATMGEAPIRAATPNELRPFQTSKAHQLFYDGARAIEHNPIGRAFFSTARLRPFVLFDQWRHGKYQKILAAAEVDRRLNGFMSNLQGALIHEKRLSEELKGMSEVEQMHALTQPRFRRDLDKIRGYVEGITGNWTAYTRFERQFSPAAVFYGFIRYAFRWPLTFAKEHPVAATVNYFLAQQNAEQVEKLLHGKPTDFYKFANPVVQDAEGNSDWLPGGSRIAPGLSAPSQALLSGNAPQAAVGSLNPIYASLVGLATGTTSFGTHDENEGLFGAHWSLAAQQLMSLPPLARLAGLGESHSDTAEQLHAADKNRKIRSFGAPFLPQSGEDALEAEEIIRSLEAEHDGSGSSSSSGNPLDALDSQLEGGGNPLDQLDNALDRALR